LIAATTMSDLKASFGKRWDLSPITNATPKTLSKCSWSLITTKDSATFDSNLLETK
jgi:hypothetical protein